MAHNYASTDVTKQWQLFAQPRALLVEFLRARSDQEWQRGANRPEIGLLTLEGQALPIPLHDAYICNKSGSGDVFNTVEAQRAASPSHQAKR